MGRGTKKGFDQLADAAALVETTQERWAEAEMHRPQGTLLLSMYGQAAALKLPPTHCCATSKRQTLGVARPFSARSAEAVVGPAGLGLPAGCAVARR
jgi:hypothetical protein